MMGQSLDKITLGWARRTRQTRWRRPPLALAPTCCAGRAVSRTRLLLVLVLLAVALVPLLARPATREPREEASELVSEALFLCDPLPPGGPEVSLAVAARPRDQVDAAGPATELHPRVQLALALAERVGVTIDVGLARDGGRLIAGAPAA